MVVLKKIFFGFIIFLGLCFCLKQLVPVLKLDGYSGLIFRILLNTDDSKYSKNYSHQKFLKIKKGMTQKEVLKILGEPMYIENMKQNIIRLQYSESPKDTHYRLRSIYLKNNKVDGIFSEFYVD